MDKERMQLVALASHLREVLKRLGYDTCKSDSHIVPIMVGNADEALELCDHLRNAGLNLACIRPPTVPPNTARLRVSLNCGHTMEQVDELLGELALSTISKKP